MNISDALVPAPWLWSGHLLFSLLLLSALRRVDWSRLRESEHSHVFLGTCVALMVMWTIKANLTPGFSFHYLGASLLTLMFGWPQALLGMTLVLAGTNVFISGEWAAFSLNALTKCAVPVLFTATLLRLSERLLPPNFFVYVFANAFFGAGLAVIAGSAAVTLVLTAAGVYAMENLLAEYLVVVPLVMFNEAWITGMLVTILVVMRPDWVHTFEDERYLRGR